MALAGEKLDNVLSFGGVAQIIRDNKYLSALISLIVFFNTFTMSVVYLNTAADFLVPSFTFIAPSAPADAWYMSRTFFLTLAWGVFGAPLSVPRTMGILQYTSTIAMVFVVYTIFLVVAYYFQPQSTLCEAFLNKHNVTSCVGEYCCVGKDCCMGPYEVVSNGTFVSFIEAFPVMITSFCCASQLFSLVNSLRRPTVARIDVGTSSSLIACFCLYVIVSVFGYMTYGSEISSDLLGSYPLTIEVTIARIGISILVIFSYPLFLHVARDSAIDILVLFFPVLKKHENALYYIMVLLCVCGTYLIALLGLDMSFLLNLIGSVAVANIAFTFPGYFYWQCFSQYGLTPTRISALAMSVFGIALMISNIVLWITG
mmetsp:Transcript_5060/g.11045  ORF Transcript_5060/g.11045 Transcript_5060/m.11045 type:complete len:371 (-) Transcript_5060:32-1144(-)